MKNNKPTEFMKGDKVRSIYNGTDKIEVRTVSNCYWQNYAGGDTSDYTVVFEEGGWNKSTNLELAIEECKYCGGDCQLGVDGCDEYQADGFN